MQVSMIQKEDGRVSLAITLGRPPQASIEHGILMMTLTETEAQQLSDALHRRKTKGEMRRI